MCLHHNYAKTVSIHDTEKGEIPAGNGEIIFSRIWDILILERSHHRLKIYIMKFWDIRRSFIKML